MVAVGDVAPFGQFDELVGLARIDDLHVGKFLLDAGTQPESQVEVDLLLAELAGLGDGTRVVSAVTGVDDDCLQAHAAVLRGCG